MPVTKTAKRALRSSKIKESVNKQIKSNLEIAIRIAKKGLKTDQVIHAVSLTDRAAKKNLIHKNKAARVKSQLSKLLTKKKGSQTAPKTQKSKKPAGRKK
jgi:small subunit ribosomal protein S20